MWFDMYIHTGMAYTPMNFHRCFFMPKIIISAVIYGEGVFMEEVKKQCSFSRSLANDAKMGAYYTDAGMCRKIRNLLSFGSDSETSCLEPSVGDGKAILTVTGKDDSESRIKIFGVELNQATAAETEKNPLINYVLQADFLNGVKISHQVFSFCFANPPYGEDENGKRYEIRFLEKLWLYLKNRAVFVLVIPEYVLRDENFQRAFIARFNPCGAWKFDDEVYRQFKQVCVIGIRKSSLGYLKDTLTAWQESLEKKELPYLPEKPVENPIQVPPSGEKDVEYFTTLEFDPEKAKKALYKSGLVSYVKLGNRIAVKPYIGVDLGSPIVPPSKDMCYLISATGGGQGFAGDETEGTLHLQRGKVETCKVSDIQYGEDGKAQAEVETTSTKITYVIVEQDGTITRL